MFPVDIIMITVHINWLHLILTKILQGKYYSPGLTGFTEKKTRVQIKELTHGYSASK